MRVLITGGSGMVGRNLREGMYLKGHTVLAPDSSELNLLDINSVTKYLCGNSPDFVIHCAGRVGGIQSNITNKRSYLHDNTLMGFHLFEGCRSAGIKRAINLASSCMFPKDMPGDISEDDLLKGILEPTNEGYALAKIAVSKLCEYISSTTDYAYKTLIPCNLYGKYDKFDPGTSHLVPSIIYKIHHAKVNNYPNVDIWGDGTARREFMHVNDFCSAVSKAVENFESIPNMLNIGMENDYSVLEYYEMAKRCIEYNGKFVFNYDKPIGMMRKKLCTRNQKLFLKWSPTIGLEEGIKLTYSYFRRTLND